MKRNFLKFAQVVFLSGIIGTSCTNTENIKQSEIDRDAILQEATNLAQTHNEGLDFIFNNVNKREILKSSSEVSIRENLTSITVDFINSNIDKINSSTMLLKNSSTSDIATSIEDIFIKYPSIGDIIDEMNEYELYYFNLINNNMHILSDENELNSLLNAVLDDENLNSNEMMGICTLIKTLEYSKEYWSNNNWDTIVQSSKLKTTADAESVILADGLYLFYGTLSGGPLVGAGAGIVASSFVALTN